MHAPTMKVASGDPEPHMPNTAEIDPPRIVIDKSRRVRKRRDDLVPLLEHLAYNLRWSWNSAARELFQSLAPEPWSRTHNPLAVLKSAANDPDRLAEHAESILEQHGALEQYLTGTPRLKGVPRIAYFCAEFAIAESLPIYSGGLGVLAGDHLKAASDLGLPLVAVGLLYRFGYFRQVIDETGYQHEAYDRLDTDSVAVRPVVNAQGAPVVIEVPFPGRAVLARVWLAQVGRIPLYLLDTDLPRNREDDRWITGHLYGGNTDTRLRQEIVLGIGGARLIEALRVLGLEVAPEVYHLNEGHSAFVAVERSAERMRTTSTTDFFTTHAEIAESVAFTTHTPVAAGHDAFPPEMIEAYLAEYRQQLGLTHAQFMSLGRRRSDDSQEAFSMTVLALRSAHARNAVSQL